MFCPECGANLPDGTVFCSECGKSLTAPQAAAPQYAAPANQPQNGYPTYHSALVNPLSKKDYIKQAATPATKNASRLALLLLVGCLVIMILGHFSMLNTSLEDIPVISVALEAADVDDEIDYLKEELDDELDLAEEMYDYYEDELEDVLSKSEMKKVEQYLDTMKACTKKVSINNIQKLTKLSIKLCKTDAAEYLYLDGVADDLEEMSEILSIVSTVLLIASILSLLFTIIGGLCRINALVILGAIGSTVFAGLLYGFLFVVLILAAHVGMVVMLSKVNKEYKAYREGTLPLNA